MAKGRLLSLSPSVLPPVMDQVRPSSSPVVVTVTTAESARAVSEMVASVSTTVGATFEIVMVIVLAVGLGGAVGRLDRQRVGGGGLEVEVVGVVDGDRAGVGVDGEGQAVVAVPVGVAAGDGPHVGDVVVAGGRDGHDRCVGGGCLVDGRLGVGDGDGDVRDRDRDVLAVVVDVVGRLDGQRVGWWWSRSRGRRRR